MSRPEKYTVRQLMSDFPDDEACFQWLVKHLYPQGIICHKCDEVTKHYRISGRRCYKCSRCNNHTYPLDGTIFHRTHVKLTDWFFAIYLMSSNKAGTSAKQLEREIGVSYRVAWRMMHKIRTMMGNQDGLLSGEIEVDEAFIHPNVNKRSSARKMWGHNERGSGNILFGAVQRNGDVRIWHVKSTGVRVPRSIIVSNVAEGSIIHSDSYGSYRRLPHYGYEHRTTNHEKFEYYTPDSYTQNIENIWSHIKRGLKGVYRHVNPGYLQLYANEYAWRYNHRKYKVLFWDLLVAVISPKPSVFSDQQRVASYALPASGYRRIAS